MVILNGLTKILKIMNKEILYKPLSFKNVDPKNIFVWSDLHLGHDKEF